LFASGDRHVTAEALYGEAVTAGYPVSLATVYNTLHQFTAAGLLRQVMIDTNRSYFDSNTRDHHHFFFEDSGELVDIPSDTVIVSKLPAVPEGTEVSRVEVVVRVHQRTS
jgi:Fur family iron response transcriptional regulator